MQVAAVGYTRIALVSEASLVQIEAILQSIARSLPAETLLFTDDESVSPTKRPRISLTSHGWLSEYVRMQLKHSNDGAAKWADYFRTESSAAPSQKVQLGDCFFTSPNGNTEVHLSFDERPLMNLAGTMRFGNWLSIRWDDPKQDNRLTETCLAISEGLFDNRLFEYGRIGLADEYDAMNLDRSGGGLQAVGLDVSKYLPGFYWGNFFGKYLSQTFGGNNLNDVHGCGTIWWDETVFVYNRFSPDRWNSVEYKATAKAALKQIGSHFFYEKGTVASPHKVLFSANR